MKLIPIRGFPIVPLLVSLFVSLCIANPAIAGTYSGGFGTLASPYQIADLVDLQELQNTSGDWSAYFIQTANIDASATSSWDSGTGWSPIGNDTTKFLGSYNGQGYTITGLRINRPDTGNVGFFGHVGYDGDGVEIENLGLIDVEIVGGRGIGTLVGRVTGDITTVIQNCYASRGSVVGDGATGGLVGSNNSYETIPNNVPGHRPHILKSWANIDVSWSRSASSGGDKFGGLTGCNQKGYIENCYARGSVTVNNNPQVGSITPERIAGLSGCILIRGYIKNSYSTGLVTVAGTVASVGGFVGSGGTGGSNGDTVDCFWDIDTSGQSSSSPTSGCTGETTANMKDLDTFTSAGWSTDTWARADGINDGYPYLNDTPLLVELASFTATPSQNGILLKWETASEIDNAGFHIWRSDTAEGTYTQITDALIPAEGEATLGAEYAYEDTDVARKVYTRRDKNRNKVYVFQDLAGGRTYYYKLEAIDNAGVSEFFGPVSADVKNRNPKPDRMPLAGAALFLVLGSGAFIAFKRRRA